jgi:hypothetical protein
MDTIHGTDNWHGTFRQQRSDTSAHGINQFFSR